MAITAWTDPFSPNLLVQGTRPEGYAVTVGGISESGSTPPPTTGQLWPRGNP